MQRRIRRRWHVAPQDCGTLISLKQGRTGQLGYEQAYINDIFTITAAALKQMHAVSALWGAPRWALPTVTAGVTVHAAPSAPPIAAPPTHCILGTLTTASIAYEGPAEQGARHPRACVLPPRRQRAAAAAVVRRGGKTGRSSAWPPFHMRARPCVGCVCGEPRPFAGARWHAPTGADRQA